MFTNTSPARAAPNIVNTHSAQFGAQMPMRSPGLSPQATSPRATRSTSRSNSANVNRVDWNGTTSAKRSGTWSTAAFRTPSTVR